MYLKLSARGDSFARREAAGQDGVAKRGFELLLQRHRRSAIDKDSRTRHKWYHHLRRMWAFPRAAEGSSINGMRWTLLGLCALAYLITIVVAIDEFGLGGRPWFGWWDANVEIARPYTVAITRPRPNGAADRAGLRDGDRVDLRDQSLETRVSLVYQLMATQPAILKVQRGNSTRIVSVVGSSVWKNATFWKLQPGIFRAIMGAWFSFCVLILALRRWRNRDARMISVVLFCAVGEMLDPGFMVVPLPSVAILQLLISRACVMLAALVLIRFASGLGTPSPWRAVLQCAAYGVTLFAFAVDSAVAFGLLTTRIDPLPYILSLSQWRGYLDVLEWLLVVVTASAAATTATRAERVRAVWLLLPLPVAFLASALCFATPAFVHSWFANVAAIAIANASMLIGSFTVMYALRKPEAEGKVSERLRVRRFPQRAVYERKVLLEVLDAGVVCHVGFVSDKFPVVIPTLYWRDETFVYFHGSNASRMLNGVEGREICLTVTHLDGLVLARSAFQHSANYRCAMIVGRPVVVADEGERERQLQRLVDALFPGRWGTLRPVTRNEMKATRILALPMEQFSVKCRQGPAAEAPGDLTWPAWGGVIPVFVSKGRAIPDSHAEALTLSTPRFDRFDR